MGVGRWVEGCGWRALLSEMEEFFRVLQGSPGFPYQVQPVIRQVLQQN